VPALLRQGGEVGDVTTLRDPAITEVLEQKVKERRAAGEE
jgi:hypothetical protein